MKDKVFFLIIRKLLILYKHCSLLHLQKYSLGHTYDLSLLHTISLRYFLPSYTSSPFHRLLMSLFGIHYEHQRANVFYESLLLELLQIIFY